MTVAVAHGGAGASPRLRLSRRWVLAVCAILLVGSAHAAPYVPTSEGEVLERLPEALDASARETRALHKQLAEAPRNLTLALQVATRDLDQGRTLADPRYLGRAEAALQSWPDSDDPPPRVTLLRAVLRQSTHDFTGARTELARVLAAEPRNAQAWLTRASIATVQGDYPTALHDCGQLALLDIGLSPAVCTASAMSVTGHAKLALAALQVAYRDADDDHEPDSVRLWAKTVAGEIAARLGDAATAEAQFRDALRLRANDAYLLGSFADYLLDRNRARDVVELLRDKTRIDPLLLRLTIAEATLRTPDAPAHVEELRARFATQRQRGETIHQREEARFTLDLLHQPAEALRLARANWQVQHEPADARILLAAARAAGTDPNAEPAAAWVRDNRIEDVALAGLLADVP
jgi:Tfp pilus assembly protein PilF